MLANYHTHCDFCDGKTTAAAMANRAALDGFKILGFSSHAPLPFRTEWNMDTEDLPAYLATLEGLVAEYSPEMRILRGLEIDYIEGYCGPREERFASLPLDYRLASVHYVQGTKPDGAGLFAVDENLEDFTQHIKSNYDGDVYRLIEDYYSAIASCVRAGGFDMLAHFDLIRKNNRDGRFFSETETRYKAAAMMAVEALAGTEIIVEINTGGMARGKTDSPYPSLWILKEMRVRNIPVCINSDAHDVQHLSAFREAGVVLARQAGYERLTVLTASGRQAVEIM